MGLGYSCTRLSLNGGEFAEKSPDTWIRGLRDREPGRSHGTLDPWGSNLVPQWGNLGSERNSLQATQVSIGRKWDL